MKIMKRPLPSELHNFSVGGMLVSMGIVFGDIGTSPIYVMSAVIGKSTITKPLVFGAVSAVFWTLIMITTIKYVYIALNADNKGEGGIFSLYALLRRYKIKWTIFPAIIGSAMLIADGFITPPISISSAVEGLNLINSDIPTVPIVICILLGIFLFQQFGTIIVGRVFGPFMVMWFIMIGFTGTKEIVTNPEILHALNPIHAINLIFEYHQGFWLLGAVFLCTTGAEALYSDLGHCGKSNIRISWIFVCIALLLNYLGQGAHLLNYENQVWNESTTPFYHLMPDWLLPFGIIITTSATIIASQALITGCFTLINEATKLRLWPNLKVFYPSLHHGQIYIPTINWILLGGCLTVVWIFGKASNMEAAYGLAIVINMIMTSSLLIALKWVQRSSKIFLICFGFFIITIEVLFFISNAVKFTHGGWFTLFIGTVFVYIMYIFFKARELRKRYIEFVPINSYLDAFIDLINDESIPKEATNLVFMSTANSKNHIDYNIIYSIFRKRPKRADVYWFVHVSINDEPFGASYEVDTIIPKKCFFVRLNFGFKVEHKVNLMFSKIVEEMVHNNEVDALSCYKSLRKHNFPADFKFIILKKRIGIDNALTSFEQVIIKGYRVIESFSLSNAEDFGLELSNLEEEFVPIHIKNLSRINVRRKHATNQTNA